MPQSPWLSPCWILQDWCPDLYASPFYSLHNRSRPRWHRSRSPRGWLLCSQFLSSCSFIKWACMFSPRGLVLNPPYPAHFSELHSQYIPPIRRYFSSLKSPWWDSWGGVEEFSGICSLITAIFKQWAPSLRDGILAAAPSLLSDSGTPHPLLPTLWWGTAAPSILAAWPFGLGLV